MQKENMELLNDVKKLLVEILKNSDCFAADSAEKTAITGMGTFVYFNSGHSRNPFEVLQDSCKMAQSILKIRVDSSIAFEKINNILSTIESDIKEGEG